MSPSADIQKEPMPSVGEAVDLPVVQSPMRMTLFPENFVLVSPAPDTMEVAFLRQELSIVGQAGTVDRSSDGSVDLRITNTTVVGQVQDLGHVRMPAAKMVEMARAILRHAQDYHGVDIKGIVSEEGGAT